MDALRFLFLSSVVASLTGDTCSGSPTSSIPTAATASVTFSEDPSAATEEFAGSSSSEYSEDAAPECEEFTEERIKVTEGEALRIVPYVVAEHWSSFTDEEFTWYKHGSQVEYVSSDQGKRIHHRGAALFFLGLYTNDSGLYITRHNISSENCYLYYTHVTVYPASQPLGSERLFLPVRVPDENPILPCERHVTNLCKYENGNLTWYRNSTLLRGKHEENLRLSRVSKADEAIYTCICTFTHNHREYNSTCSRWFLIEEASVPFTPQIITPANDTQFADEGSSVTLNCTAFCGMNWKYGCSVEWFMDGKYVWGSDEYNVTLTSFIVEPEKQSFVMALLTIHRVSAPDFQAKFQCFATNGHMSVNAALTLKRRESMTPLIRTAVFVVLLCVSAAVMIKCFDIELALFFRRYFKFGKEDGKVYDAYVVYQTQQGDKALEETLGHFVSVVLPSVLEKKCGYRLFIHGRDDIPGEDHLELVESRVRLTRRLMVILTPGSGSGSEVTGDPSLESPVFGGYDWQVGLHEALVQREMKVIIIQLGDMQGYTHLPPGLQHLVRKSAPLKWQEDSRGAAMWNSSFWKRVRYMMPATPARSTTQSAIV